MRRHRGRGWGSAGWTRAFLGGRRAGSPRSRNHGLEPASFLTFRQDRILEGTEHSRFVFFLSLSVPVGCLSVKASCILFPCVVLTLSLGARYRHHPISQMEKSRLGKENNSLDTRQLGEEGPRLDPRWSACTPCVERGFLCSRLGPACCLLCLVSVSDLGGGAGRGGRAKGAL